MRIHDILEDILDSRSKVKILRLVYAFPQREFTEREIARDIKMSPNTVNLSLQDLRSTNLFHYKRIGRTHSYACNKESSLYPLLNGLFKEEAQVWNSMVGTIKESLSDAKRCLIFGSFARGEEEFDSDLDLLVVTPDKERVKKTIGALSVELARVYSVTLSPFILTPKEFKEKADMPFIRTR
jgi:predicted nucleotidyltransferase